MEETNPSNHHQQQQQQLLLLYNQREPHFPSYADTNDYGFCLRASEDLDEVGTIIATADFEKSEKEYIASHEDENFKFVAVFDVVDGVPKYGKVRGKWAFSNHSCESKLYHLLTSSRL